MSEKQNEERALRTIVVSARSALRTARNDEERERIQDRVHDLLSELEAIVIRDGADPTLLERIEQKRRRLWD
jgi:hypothetical protein